MVTRRHILFIVENNTVPFDRRVLAEARAAREFGFDVSVICPFDRVRKATEDIIDGIRIYRHPRMIEGLGKLSMVLEYLNATFWEFLWAGRIFLGRPFSVIHSANPPDHVFLIARAFRFVGVRFVFDHHDLTPETYVAKYGSKGIAYRLLLWMERLTFRSADIVISTNESYKKVAIERGGKSENDVYVVRNGPDLSMIPEVRPNPALKGGFRYLIGYVGIIGKQEGLDNLLEIADHIVRKMNRKDVKFAVIGTGTYHKSVSRKAKAMGLEQHVQFFGWVPDALMHEILATADVCVNPEFRNPFTDKSTMIKVMEYMSFRKPIVQFFTTESEFTAGKAAISVKDNDTIQFAEAVLSLLDDPARRKQMGDFGRERIKKHLNWQIQKRNLKAVFDRIMSGLPSK